MTAVCFTIPGQARGKERPRLGRGNRVFTPPKTLSAENLIKDAAFRAMDGRAPLAGPLEMTVHFMLTVPPSWSKTRRVAALAGEILPTVKPDIDNAVKLVADACNQIVYPDDSAIASMVLLKSYCAVASTVVTVRCLTAENCAALRVEAEVWSSGYDHGLLP